MSVTGVVAVRFLAKGGELVTLQMVDGNTVNAGMLARRNEVDATWADGQQASFRARFIAEEAARVEEAEQGERKKKEVAAKNKELHTAREEKHKIRFMEEKQEVDALYAQAVRTTKLTVTNAQQICALSLSLSKRVYTYSGHQNKHWSWKRLCPLCMENIMGLGNQKCTVCRF